MMVFNESGKGYWMEGFGCLRAEGENRPSRPGHIVILNDQGGSVMDASEDVTATLRAQDHGHPPVVCMAFDVYNMQGNDKVFKTLNSVATDSDHIPVLCQCAAFIGGQGAKARSIGYSEKIAPTIKSVPSGGNTIPDVVYCFEPGIAKREGSNSRFVKERCVTLRADMGDNQPAVVYPINLMVATRGGKDDMRTCFGIGEENDPQFTLSAAHEHGVCYEVQDG